MGVEFGTLASGFAFSESPRWHDGRVWVSDIFGHQVIAVGMDGSKETVADIREDEPSGLGWLPDGRLLVVSMNRRQLLRLEGDGSLSIHADLSEVAIGKLNDMVVAADGTAYVGDMGGNRKEGHVRESQAFCVRPDGSFELAAGDLAAPNGIALSADESTLVVAEFDAMALTVFNRRTDGSLTARRPLAGLAPATDGLPACPDGICLDAEGGVWVALPHSRRVARVSADGSITHNLSFGDETPAACVLAGPDRRTLVVCCAADLSPGSRSGRLATCRVDVPGEGAP